MIGLIMTCAALLTLTVPLCAAAVELKPATDMEGYQSLAVPSVFSTTTYIVAGNNNQNAFDYRGVMKFPLASISDFSAVQVSEATLRMWLLWAGDARGDNGVYVQLQHYTYDNTAVFSTGSGDASTAAVENVGSPVLMRTWSGTPQEGFGTLKTWDVTSYVKADRLASYTNTAFRLLATDADGNPVNVGNHGAFFYSQESVYFGGSYTPTDMYARIDVVPEPGTIGLLLLGSSFLFRRR